MGRPASSSWQKEVVGVAQDVRRLIVAALVLEDLYATLDRAIERRIPRRAIRRAASASPPKGVAGAGSTTNSAGGGRRPWHLGRPSTSAAHNPPARCVLRSL